jgi:hypothetical protein
MADSKVQREAEAWIRETWLPDKYGQRFRKRRLDQRSGGQFEFDGVSEDKSLAVAISTNGGVGNSGKKASSKLTKIRSDPLFLMLADVSRRLIVFSDQAMFELCDAEVRAGRFPTEIEIRVANLPDQIETRLLEARRLAADEVTPSRRS